MEKQDIERLAKLETEIKAMRDLIMNMDSKLDIWNKTFVPRNEINEMFRSRDKEVNELSQDLEKIRENVANNQQDSSTKWEHFWSKAVWFLIGLFGSIFMILFKDSLS
ncbi:hypothetical protein [Chengkuizengella axinellae]|uniref:Uncharacterized protein n=1 Tax=Chengkuizengella axinellae TaxID=3064388 RepID=A0ABT9J4C4_9BACL|nr:hypothetical protein [Chengkuizengella sp. 2205SS18-9]MDP5276477.1 hypothetical protein [Chengkuizengella sp. 2205SS18-9]